MNIRQALISNIESDLLKILTGNGYNYNVNKVFKHFVDPEAGGVNLYPGTATLWFEFQNAEKEAIDEAKTQFYVRENWMIGGYIQTSQDVSLTGTLVVEAEKLKADIENNVENRKPESFTINQIDGVDYAFVNQDYPYIVGNNNVVGVVKGIQISYIQTENSNNIDITLPIAPTLSTPSNGGTATTLYPALDWGSVSDAISYHVQVGTDTGFNSCVIDQEGIEDSSFTIPNDKVLSNGIAYYWRIRSFNNQGYSTWSSVYSFIVSSTTTVEFDWNEFSISNGWWNSFSSNALTISSGAVSAMKDQINTRNLTQATAGDRPALSGNAWNSLSSVFFNPTFTTAGKYLSYNDTSAVFRWENSTTGSIMFVVMTDGNGFDLNSGYNVPFARSNTNYGQNVALTRGVNTGPVGYSWGYPTAVGDYGVVPIGLNIPQHVVITHSGSSALIYLNGTKIGQVNKTLTTFANELGSYLVLGQLYNGSLNYSSGRFYGHFFEFGTASAELTATQVKQNYAKFKTRYGL